MIHKPVLLKEVIENLNLKSGMTVIDGTLGAGGHAIEILKKILPGGKLITIDWDKRAIEHFPEKLEKEGFEIRPAPVKSNSHDIISSNIFRPLWRGNQIVGHWCGVNDNYSNLDKIIRGLGVKTVDAVFVDLGFSSDQIEDAKRGFSFLKNGPLDMRYSPEMQEKTAADVVSRYSEEKLIEIFRNYGEERYARSIARGIVKARRSGEIKEIERLVEIISRAVPENYKKRKIHFATKVFQALRVEVNQELSNLKKFLIQSLEVLASGPASTRTTPASPNRDERVGRGGGRLAVISFHSLEDRIVKNFFQKESRDCICPPNFPKCVCAHKRQLKIITKKPIVPGEKETEENPRARSAKLRVAEKM